MAKDDALERVLAALLQLARKTFGPPQRLPLAVVFLLLRAQRDAIVRQRVADMAATTLLSKSSESEGQMDTKRLVPSELLRPLARKLAVTYDCATPRERAQLQRELAACGAEDILVLLSTDDHQDTGRLFKRKRVEEAAGTASGPPRALSGRQRRRRRQCETSGAFAPMEEGVLFSQSCLWDTNERFYETSGLDPWTTNQVPCGITSSSFLADRYARVIVEFCRRQDHNLKCSTVHILDLGSGHGTFAVRLARALRQKLSTVHEGSSTLTPRACVIMSDFHSGAMDQLMTRSDVCELVRQGWLDFAVIDLRRAGTTAYQSLRLRGSNRIVDLSCGPIVAVCNYVLDSLPADVCATNARGLHQVATCTTWPRRLSNRNDDLSTVPNTASVELDFATHAPGSVLEDPRARAVLDAAPQHRTVLLNSRAACALCDLIGAGTERQALVLVADKMQDSIHDAMAWHAGVPGLDRHGDAGCISCAVDPYTLETFIASDERVRSCVAGHLDDPGQSLGLSVYCVNAESISDAKAIVAFAQNVLHDGFTVTDFDRLQGWLVDLRPDDAMQLLADMGGSKGFAELLALAEGDFELFWTLKWALQKVNPPKELVLDLFARRFPLSDGANARELVEMAQWFLAQGERETAEALHAQLPRDAPIKGRHARSLAKLRSNFSVAR
ncbi:Hypothetical Protein FCC1311_059732 [Hondaea fermentalgiana]|uniref:Uncharacterized protein n=1 Tax=Hondaea fermentalgiana TaxID=2315210 RepID=A0A2R5GFR4_9STRA|nr:Hypothetical Protein FCC1311_059732 [Hondaea fermentalgiana]|eukprot:GBG29752.1 Hypothetical Protein FCC1311_059732 [Hondaea fermentalgiana]